MQSILDGFDDGGNLVLQLEAMLLEVFEHFIGCRLVSRFDPMERAIDLVIAGREAREIVIGLDKPTDGRHGFGELDEARGGAKLIGAKAQN